MKNRSEKFEYNMNLTNTITKIDENNTDVEFEFGDFSLETDGNIHVIFSNSDISTPIYILKVIWDFKIIADCLKWRFITDLKGEFALFDRFDECGRDEWIVNKFSNLLETVLESGVEKNECAVYEQRIGADSLRLLEIDWG